ncbi:hypothetical protein C3V36_04755 [Lachnospiraceae bacterium oral taxon 500]|nr:hypothetical protein C3V36_04755 [Lachnospiraceae bacterium oral taxon 500]
MKRYLALVLVWAILTGCGSMELPQDKAKTLQPKETTESGQPADTKQPDEKAVEEKTTAGESNKTAAEKTEETKPEPVPEQKGEPEKAEEKEPAKTGPAETETSGETENKKKEPVKNTGPEIVNQFSNQTEYNPPITMEELSTEAQSWSFKRNKEHLPVTGYYQLDLAKYGAYYLGNTEEKVVYLTFDEGYENGFTPAILDTLKEKQIKAAFFITGSYLKHSPELVKRMKEEGHVVGNHSQTHPDFTTQTDEQVIAEVSQVADKFKEVVGTEMDPFFRFPSGRYSEKDLYIVRKLGFRSIFWSMAYKDWDTKDQPGKDYAYQHVMANYHPGVVILLHAVSSSNTEALADIITGLDEAGYRFGSLYELE